MVGFVPKAAAWFVDHFGITQNEAAAIHVTQLVKPASLLGLPTELQCDIFSRLPITDLTKAERVSRNAQRVALAAWFREIPKDKLGVARHNMSFHMALAATPGAWPRPMRMDALWKQAWLDQCKMLETFEYWGAVAAQACLAMPDVLNPFDVAERCREWLEAEAALDNSDHATRTLKDVFIALKQNARALDLSWRGIHSLPPFIDKVRTLDELDLGFNQLTEIDSSCLTGIKRLRLHCNRLTHFDVSPLEGVEELLLDSNHLAHFDASSLAEIKWLGLSENYLTHFEASGKIGGLNLRDNFLTEFDASSSTAIEMLILANNDLSHFDVSRLSGIRELDLCGNRLTNFDATGLVEIEHLLLRWNQLVRVTVPDLKKACKLDLRDNHLSHGEKAGVEQQVKNVVERLKL